MIIERPERAIGSARERDDRARGPHTGLLTQRAITGVELDEHINFVIAAMQPIAADVGLAT